VRGGGRGARATGVGGGGGALVPQRREEGGGGGQDEAITADDVTLATAQTG